MWRWTTSYRGSMVFQFRQGVDALLGSGRWKIQWLQLLEVTSMTIRENRPSPDRVFVHPVGWYRRVSFRQVRSERSALSAQSKFTLSVLAVSGTVAGSRPVSAAPTVLLKMRATFQCPRPNRLFQRSTPDDMESGRWTSSTFRLDSPDNYPTHRLRRVSTLSSSRSTA